MRPHKHTVVTSERALRDVYERSPIRVKFTRISQGIIYGEIPRGHTPSREWTVVTLETLHEHADEIMSRLNIRMIDPALHRRKAARRGH